MKRFLSKTNRRFGGVQLLIIILLVIMILLLAIVLFVLTRGGSGGGGGGDRPPTLTDGDIESRGASSNPPSPPKPVGDPDRVREVAQAGKTYQNLIKGGLNSRVTDKSWGIEQVTNLAYAFQFPFTRRIEKNDGRTIVEVREFGEVGTVKLLTEVESVRFGIGNTGRVMLSSILEAVKPGSGQVVISAMEVAEVLLHSGAQMIADSNSKAFVSVDSLAGKKVRITYEDGRGVTEIQPIGCSLNVEERDYIFGIASLLDYFAMPDVETKEGKSWSIDGSQLGSLIDPSLRGVSSGEVVVTRGSDRQDAGKQLTELHIQRGFLKIDRSDPSRGNIGSFEPRGSLTYNVTDGHIATADLKGAMKLEEVSKDHILFETRFVSKNEIEVSYFCEMK
jgi:hypothetical protein